MKRLPDFRFDARKGVVPVKRLAILVALTVLVGCGGVRKTTVTKAELETALRTRVALNDAILAQQDASRAALTAATNAFYTFRTFEVRTPDERQATLKELTAALEKLRVAEAALSAAAGADRLDATLLKILEAMP